ncbi:dynamin family protein [Streptacidiphilus cavernicola]|uniref:Dynamin family protein n=1 Tax=Streptacidiphilus cavernicola TaxID=3342716 RepID=A0ABV6VZW8_9ACTN
MDAALGRALSQLPTAEPSLAEARRLLAQRREEFPEPMRVALVGRVSAGKSTLVNALLGEPVMATGQTELTLNVCRLRHTPTPELTIHYQDGRIARAAAATVEELANLTAHHRTADPAFLAAVDHAVFGYPSPRLADFDLIDTPGLDSVFASDTASTLSYLRLRGPELDPDAGSEPAVAAAARERARKADALVHVFSSRGRSAGEDELLRDFKRAATELTSPITAIGALTKVERYWRHDRQDVLAVGRTVADRLMREGGANRQLYELRPLASLVGAAAGSFTGQDFADLTALATDITPALLTRKVGFGPGFAGDALDGFPVPAPRRASLLDRFSAHGITLACDLIRQGIDDPAELRRELHGRSGMTGFWQLLRDHFVLRADLIKLQSLISEADELAARSGGAVDPRLRRATVEITEMAYQEHAFDELTVVRNHYAGMLRFSLADAADALRIVGERGYSAALRLGLPSTAPSEQLSVRARERSGHWAALAIDPACSGPTRRACRVVQRSLDALIAATATG